MDPKLPIIFFGASKFVLPILDLLRENYELKLVVTTETDSNDSVPSYCKKHAIPFESVQTTKGLLALTPKLLPYKFPVAILAYFGLIIPQGFIDIFPKGIVNIHPSRLPLYRGTTPGQTALIMGDIKTGVSIMLLDKEMDHGPVLAQEEEIITSTDNAVTLYERLFAKGVALLDAVIPAYLSGQLKPVEQDHNKATYTKPLTRESGFLDSTKPISPELLDRLIRAYYPWPGVWTRFVIRHSELVSESKSKIVKFLPNKMIQVEGKKPMSYKDFMNGYPEGKEFLKKLQLI